MSSNRELEKRVVHIGIVGLGARGLSVLERITAHYRDYPSKPPIHVHVIDPREHGAGTHITRQPDHLLVNTVASQVTMFSDSTVKMEGPIYPGPKLAEWAKENYYRRVGDTVVQTKENEGQEISDNDYVPRRVLGDYLSWTSDHIVGNLPQNVTVKFHRAEATNIIDEKSGQYVITLSHGFSIRVQYVFLCLGHGTNMESENDYRYQLFAANNKSKNADINFLRSCYPLARLEEIAPKATVAVQGVGLSAHDVIAELTIGRRGRFVVESDATRYIASGREPKITLFSRQGLPFEARGINQKGVSGQYSAEFFTEDYVRLQKERYGALDFRKHLLPCLIKEMKNAANKSLKEFAHKYRASIISELHERIDLIFERNNNYDYKNIEEFQKFVISYIERDLDEAEQGNIRGPYKAATDVLRDVRDTIRLAVDWGGLTPESHQAFLRETVPIMNRIAVGPPKVRNQQLLALMKAGVVSMAGGPNASVRTNSDSAKFEIVTRFASGETVVSVDVLIAAMIDPFYPLLDRSEIIRNLLRQGSIIPYFNGSFHPGGIAIERDYRPLKANQRPHDGIWALGNLVEGPNFYTFVLPRPGVNSRFIRDADACVSMMINDIDNRKLNICE